jgi:hypothetical protein
MTGSLGRWPRLPVTERGRKAAGSVLLAALFATAPLYADYRDSFQRGYQAINRGRFVDAISLLHQALAEKPNESGEMVTIIGSFSVQYLPHYYLGVALARGGNCPAALREWEQSESQGVIKTSSEAGALRESRAKCGGDPQVVLAKTAATTVLDTAQAQDKTLHDLLERPRGREVVARDPDLPNRQHRLEQTLSSIADQVARSKTTPEASAALDAATGAARQMHHLLEQARTIVAEAREAAEQPPAPAAQATPPAPVPSAGKTPRMPAPPAATAETEALHTAGRAFFAGDYGGTLGALRAVGFTNRRAGAQAALFQAAARMAQYWLGGEQDEALVRQAQEDVAACKRLNRTLRPSAKFFSPRFVAFFAHAR